MSNLQVSNNMPQSSGNATNMLPASIMANGSAMDVQTANPFAFLLAQQIGGPDLSVPDAAQARIAIDGNTADSGTGQSMKDTQDEVAASAPEDSANMLAAILIQLPVPEDKSQKANGQKLIPSTPLDPFQKVDNLQTMRRLAQDSSQITEDPQTIQPFATDFSQEPGHHKLVAAPADHPSIQLTTIGHLPPEKIKLAELSSNLTQPAPNIAQAIISQPTSNVMQSVPANNLPPSISTPLGNHGWAEEFSQKISWMSTQQNQVAELHLNPPNLGPLDVVLKISDNQATALFTSPHGAVREAVENALPKLREILADNGIMLGNATISDQPPRDRGTDGFMNQGFGTAARHEVPGTEAELASSSSATLQIAPARRHNGIVDTFA